MEKKGREAWVGVDRFCRCVIDRLGIW